MEGMKKSPGAPSERSAHTAAMLARLEARAQTNQLDSSQYSHRCAFSCSHLLTNLQHRMAVPLMSSTVDIRNPVMSMMDIMKMKTVW